jgi:hypothetical protein
MPLSNYSLNKFVAPKLSELRTVGAPDLRSCTKEYGNWVNNFILNTILKVRLPKRKRQLVMYFLRKVEGAFYEYHEGRNFLEGYLQNQGQAISLYFHSLRCFEVSALLAYHAYETIRTMIQEDMFTPNDGSPLQRLNRIQNISKHANGGISRGEVPDDLSLPIWLTNEFIECHNTKLSFSEFAEILVDLAKLAEVLSSQTKVKK